jgi:hypothetical protein
MANVYYTRGINAVHENWTTGVFRVALVRSTSAYTPDKDHDYLSEFASGEGVEISVASYARQTVANATKTIQDASDRTVYSCDTVSFGELESGQTVQALLVYQQVGGDATTPETDILVAYIDTDGSGLLPAALSNGIFSFTLPNGLFSVAQAA